MHKVTICHISFNHSPFDDRIYWKELLSLKDAGYNAIHIAVDDIDADYISKEGIRIITVKRRKKHQNKWLNKFIQFIFRKNTTIAYLYEKAKQVNAQVYHYHDLQLNALSQKLKCLSQKPKVIYDAHEAYHLMYLDDMPTSNLYKPFFNLYIHLVKRWELYFASFCNYIITTDEYTYRYFTTNLPSTPTSIIFNYSFFQPENHGKFTKNFHFIYSGSISRNRGILEMVYSINLLKQIIPDVKLMLVGSFENVQFRQHIEDLTYQLDLRENIIIKKFIPFENISDLYNQSLIGLCFLYDTPKFIRAIPIKLFEYMAFGLPVIFSNHGPSSNIIKNSNCGLLVDFKDIKMIRNAMLLLLTNKELYNELSKNGMNTIKNKFTWAKEQEELLKIYRTLLDSPT